MQNQTTPASADKAAVLAAAATLTDQQIADRLILERLASGEIEKGAAAQLAKGPNANPFNGLTEIFNWPFASSVDFQTAHFADFTGDDVESFLQNDAGERLPIWYMPVEPRAEQRTRAQIERLPQQSAETLLRHLAGGKVQRAAQAMLDGDTWPDVVSLAAILKAPNSRAPVRAVAIWRASLIVAISGKPYVAHFADDEGNALTWQILPVVERAQ